MTWWQAIILGIVEGVTEYLPVSSTGHLILAQRAMGIGNSEAANAYAICIQGGAILAVLLLYHRRVTQGFRGTLLGAGWLLGRKSLMTPSDLLGLKLTGNLFVACLPLIGVVFLEKLIKEHLFNLWAVTFAWFVGGVAILAVTWLRPKASGEKSEGMSVDAMTWRMALIIGTCQCIAVWPGTSRALVTIVAGVMVGLSLRAAVEFSFLLGVITLTAATAKDALDSGDVMLAEYGWLTMLLGFAFAFVSAVAAVKWMVAYLEKHSLAVFGWYRVGLAAVVAVLIYRGVLSTSLG